MQNLFKVGDTVERYQGGHYSGMFIGDTGVITGFDEFRRHIYFGNNGEGYGHSIGNFRLVKPAKPALLTEVMKFKCSKGKTYATAMTALKASTRNTVAPDLSAVQVETLIKNRDALREVFDLADKYDVEKVGA